MTGGGEERERGEEDKERRRDGEEEQRMREDQDEGEQECAMARNRINLFKTRGIIGTTRLIVAV